MAYIVYLINILLNLTVFKLSESVPAALVRQPGP
jgi:hypothetical protein